MSAAGAVPMLPAGRGAASHLVAIDVLRGIAALGVAIFHARVAWWVGWRDIQANPDTYSSFDRAVAWLSAPTPFLGSLVMLFFVVSGFCVHRPLGEGPLAARDYFFRRLLRIYPPYLVAAVLSLGVSAWLGEALTPGGCATVLFMAQNYAGGWSSPVAAGQPVGNPALWSIPVEVELYLAYPVLRWLVSRWGWSVAMAAVGGVSGLALAAYHGGGWVLEGNFALYWILWCGGAWLRERWTLGTLRVPPLGWSIGAGLALAASVALTLRGVGGVTQLCWGLVYFWLVWRVLLAPGTHFSGEAWLRILGGWSYSLYLVHFPLLLATGAVWLAAMGGKPANFLVPLASCVVILPAVWLFYRAVERPSHRLARRWGGRRAA